MSEVEQVFNFGAQQVRTVMVDGEPRFVAADVCAVLGHTNPTVAVGRLEPIPALRAVEAVAS